MTDPTENKVLSSPLEPNHLRCRRLGTGQDILVVSFRANLTVERGSEPTTDMPYWTRDVLQMGDKRLPSRLETNGGNAAILDACRRKIYWTEVDGIVRVNLDGSQRETIVSDPEGCVRAIDSGRGKIYWGGSGGLQRANLDGSQRELLFILMSGGVTHIAIDEGRGKIYWTAGHLRIV